MIAAQPSLESSSMMEPTTDLHMPIQTDVPQRNVPWVLPEQQTPCWHLLSGTQEVVLPATCSRNPLTWWSLLLVHGVVVPAVALLPPFSKLTAPAMSPKGQLLGAPRSLRSQMWQCWFAPASFRHTP